MHPHEKPPEKPKPEKLVFKVNRERPTSYRIDHETGAAVNRIIRKYPEAMDVFAMQGLHAISMLDSLDRRRGPEAVRRALEIFSQHGGITQESKLELGKYLRATNPKAKKE